MIQQNQVFSIVSRAEKILLLAPKLASGDAICAMLAWQIVLTRSGKSVVSAMASDVPKKFKFLAGSDQVRFDLAEEGDFVISISTKNAKADRVKYALRENAVDIIVSPKSGQFSPNDVEFRRGLSQFDLAIVCGAKNMEACEPIFSQYSDFFARVPIVNFDVSTENEFFGKINWVDHSACSLCELFFSAIRNREEFLKYFDSNLTTILLAGIISATGSFGEPSSSAGSFEIAAELQSLGANQPEIIENLFKRHSLATLKIWGRILDNLEIDEIHKIAVSSVANSDFSISGANPDDVGEFSTLLLRHTRNGELTMLLIERKNCVEVQIRSGCPAIDFEILNSKFSDTGERREFGLDFKISGKSIFEVKSEFQKVLTNFQKSRLGIPGKIHPKKMEIFPKKAEKNMFFDKKHDPETTNLPMPPKNVPFEVPRKD